MIKTPRSFPDRIMHSLVILLALSLLHGCDAVGRSSSSSSQTSKPSQSLSVTVAPLAVEIRAGDAEQFSATVSGSVSATFGYATNKKVIWSINGIPGGNAAVGTISVNGLYTSPSTLPTPNAVEVTATSVAEPSVSQSALLTLYNPIPTVTSVAPSKVSVGAFTLTVSGRGFVAGAEVLFAGTPLPTTLDSPTQLLARGVAIQPGNAQVQVTNPGPGSASSTASLTVQVTPPLVTAPPATPNPSPSQADVIVDASHIVSDTGMDDLVAAKNIYAAASAPESDGGLYPDWNLISSQFTMKRMRNINGLGDCALDPGGHLNGCTRLNNDLQNIRFRNLTPHVVVGQWVPSSIGGNPRQWGAPQWAQYDALCYAIVNYVANQFGGTGFSEALFEVENEMDTTQDPRDLWLTTTSNVPQGDPSRFAQFDTVYRHWANAVKLVAQQSPNKKIRIAAPATGFWSVYYGSGQLWHNQIIQKYAALGIKFDVISLHIYGGEVNDLAKYARSIRSTLIANGNPNAEIWVTEWGASDLGDSKFGAINGSHEGAAWAINFLLQALKGTVTGGAFLEVRDNQGHDTAGAHSNMYEASWNHVENSIEYPKAIANAFNMVDRMKGTRKSVEVDAAKPNLLAFASSDSRSASLTVANYNYDFDYAHKSYSDRASNEAITVAFKNLPLSGPVIVDRYLIDAQTSNLNYWIAAGKTPPSVQATQLQRVESFSTNSTNGALILPARQLGQSAVSLWIVHQ